MCCCLDLRNYIYRLDMNQEENALTDSTKQQCRESSQRRDSQGEYQIEPAMDRHMELFTDLLEGGVEDGVTNGCVYGFDWGNGCVCKFWQLSSQQRLLVRMMGNGRQLSLLTASEVKHYSVVLCDGFSTKFLRYLASSEKECGLVHSCNAHALACPHHHLCIRMLEFG